MPIFCLSCLLPPFPVWWGSTLRTISQFWWKVERNRQTALLGHSGDTPAVGSLVFDTGLKGEPVVAGGCGAAGVGLQYLFHADHLVGAGAQLGCPGDGIAYLQRVELAKVISDTAIVVEWGSTALPHFCGRFAPPPLRTVRTPLDVHGSPSLLHLTKLFCHELACDNLRRPPMFSAVWQS